MPQDTQDMQVEFHPVIVRDIGKNYAGRYVTVVVAGDRIELKVPKGTRGLKVGSFVTARVEHRDWFNMHRVSFNMREGTSDESVDRVQYDDGVRPHYFLELAR